MKPNYEDWPCIKCGKSIRLLKPLHQMPPEVECNECEEKERKVECKWTKEWPNEPGSYWFYGCLYKGEVPKLYYIECWEVGNGNMFVANGSMWNKTEAGPGVFAKIDIEGVMESVKDFIPEKKVKNEKV